MSINYKLFDTKFVHYSIIIWSSIFIICISSISIYAIIKIEKLENELEITKKSVIELEKYFDFMKDLGDYEFGTTDTDYVSIIN